MIASGNTLFGGAIIAGALYLLTEPFSLSPSPFMTVHRMEYLQGTVHVERTIRVPQNTVGEEVIDRPIIADWRVTGVGEGANSPTCQTVPGPKQHEGWSTYGVTERKQQSFLLDEWVGDPGCADRLTPGDYTMFVTWTPRNGSDPVARVHRFIHL